MPDLIAQGTRREHRWRRRLPLGDDICIGRSSGEWSVPWDEHISRQHISVSWDDVVLRVESLPRTSNSVFFRGSAVQSLRLRPGEHFVIGNTTFTLSEESISVAVHGRLPATEQTFSHDYLRHLRFRDPGDWLEIISKLPERVARASDHEDLYELIIRVVLEGISNASAAAICIADKADVEEIQFVCWDRSDSRALDASRRLIHEAVSTGESVVHTWSRANVSGAFTENDDFAWAFCSPFRSTTTGGRALYVAGTRAPQAATPTASDLEEEMKFAEIVVTTVSSFQDVRQLQKQQSSLGQFFSAPVIHALRDGNANEALAPREVDVTVLFCDLRGFSLATEQFADDLLGLLQRVSDALGVLTKQILHDGGVIGDFHGDAAMGFWGWPLPQGDAAARAARAALAIFDEFSNASTQADHSLSRFRMGVGIASGAVVAGKIGTIDQVKVTAFGPAVNLASRLESMTKQLNSPILVDSETAQRIRRDPSVEMRLRRLAVVQPYGMEAAIEIHQLLPCVEQYPLLSDDHIRNYELALDAFVSGDWNTAWEELHKVPAADPSKDFLTTYIASRNRIAPQGWSGVIRLESK